MSSGGPAAAASVNGVALKAAGEALAGDELRQRACTELLRQAAIRAGLLAGDDPPPAGGAISEAASAAIEALLDRELAVPEPDEQACRRHHAAHAARYAVGERARLRHILFAVTPGVDLDALRGRAESCLIELRSRGRDEAIGEADRFAAAARELSNCPSGADGDICPVVEGWRISSGSCATRVFTMAKDPCKIADRKAGCLTEAPMFNSHRIESSACSSLLSGPRMQALANILDRTV